MILEYIISSFMFFVISIVLFCIIHCGEPKAHTHVSLGSTANIFSQHTSEDNFTNRYSDILVKEGFCMFYIAEL